MTCNPNTQQKVYDIKTMKAAVKNINAMIPLLQKQIALYEEMKCGFEYRIEEQEKEKKK